MGSHYSPMPADNGVKKIHGQVHYFGVWEDPQAAVEPLFGRARLSAQRPSPTGRRRDHSDVLNSFRGNKLRAMERDDITERTYNEYVSICDTIANIFGKHRPINSLTHEDLDRLRSKLGRNKKGSTS